MSFFALSLSVISLSLPALMLMIALVCINWAIPIKILWKIFFMLSGFALLLSVASLVVQITYPNLQPYSLLPGLTINPIQSWIAFLVQILATVIGVFSSRYLQGEAGQLRYISAFSLVIAFVHILLLADHWFVLIGAWAMAGMTLERLLCFYSERPFAALAAHKKFIADRMADVLLIIAASLAWNEIGNGSLSSLFAHVAQTTISTQLHISAVLLVMAVVIRTALFPVHGWLIQVMEAPTPVSALLHAGVVNLGGFVLISFAPLLQQAFVAKWLLVIWGMVTAICASLVMLTRISIKVKLAWSTVAQMGFMILECGLGLYTLAAMHLIGHSLYKAHAFLASSSTVQQYKTKLLYGSGQMSKISLLLAPVWALIIVLNIKYFIVSSTWPWWWSAVLALAWAPILWTSSHELPLSKYNKVFGIGIVTTLTLLVSLLHKLPFGTHDVVNQQTGVFTLFGMTLLYYLQVALKIFPNKMFVLQRWSYAGFYVDEAYTRLALKLFPINWASLQLSPSKF